MLPPIEPAALAPDQAAALVRVIDLQARWECQLADASGGGSVPDLQARQKAYEAYRARRAEYDARYGAGAVPETSAGTPDRLAGWCRAVATVVRRAGGAVLPAAVEKAYRLADRVAGRQGAEPVRRGPGGDAAGALDAVAGWCDGLTVIPGGRGWDPAAGRRRRRSPRDAGCGRRRGGEPETGRGVSGKGRAGVIW